MASNLARNEDLSKLCQQINLNTDRSLELDSIVKALKSLMPELDLTCALTRGNWYRLGGIVDKDFQPISNNIALWSENECAGDVDEIILKHINSGYFATRLAGKTHYFTAQYGTNNEQFIQLEIEELEEVIDRPLVDKDWFPDCLEDFIDPLDFPKLEPEPTGQRYYQFRRITDVSELLNKLLLKNRARDNLQRFFKEWNQSSAFDEHPFCRHWILALREYQDSDRKHQLRAKPVSTYAGKLSKFPPVQALHGTELSKAIHHYDHQLGYPFAWYFTMLSNKSGNYKLAQAVLRDQADIYEYLPAKDLKILRQWEEHPYGV